MLILAFALPVLLIKLSIAATTFGTNDIVHWADFLAGERRAGPVGIYALTFPNGSFYNHPPLIGYLLAFLNLIQDAGIPFRFTLRALSSLADVGTALLVFELLRRRQPVARARLAAVLVAVSPLLVMVSGFHGNTDPIFVLLVLLGAHLLVDRRLPVLAGAAIALSVSVKIVPMVVIPALAVYAFRRSAFRRDAARRDAARTGPGDLLRCLVGFAVVFGLVWGPALILQFRQVRTDVIGYGGFAVSPWGIRALGHWMGDPSWVHTFSSAVGRAAVVAVCALLPACAVWRRPDVVLPAVAWSLIGFLVLAPSWGVQYMVWPLAACYLIGPACGTAYNLVGSVVLFVVYNRWSGGLPWYRARATFVVPEPELLLMMLAWAVLAAVLIRATIKIFPSGPGRGAGTGVDPHREDRL